MKFKENDTIYLCGDSKSLGIVDYNCNVDTYADVIIEPTKYAKKMLVNLHYIDNDVNVNTYVKINKCKKIIIK